MKGKNKRPGPPSHSYSAVLYILSAKKKKKRKIKLLCHLNCFSLSFTDGMELNQVGLKLYKEMTP